MIAEQHDTGNCGVRHIALAHQRGRHGHRTVGNASSPWRARKSERANGHGLKDGSGYGSPTEFFNEQNRVDEAAAHAAIGFGKHHRQHTHLGQTRPQRCVVTSTGFPHLAQMCSSEFAFKHLAQACCELLLI